MFSKADLQTLLAEPHPAAFARRFRALEANGVLHRFAEAFEDHAILKGGIALRLFDCPRSTTDIDYVFVPFRTKKDARGRIEGILGEIEGAEVAVAVHSKMLRASVRVDSVAIQIEVSSELRAAADSLTESALRDELAPILPDEELVALVPRIRSVIVRIGWLESSPTLPVQDERRDDEIIGYDDRGALR